MNTKRRISHKTATLTRTRGRIIDIAQHLGPSHLEAVKLMGQGKRLRTVAQDLGISETTTTRLLSEAKMHLRHFDETGKMPDKKPACGEAKKHAAELIALHFPELKGDKASRYRAVAARALENKLPTNPHYLSALRDLINRIPHPFPSEIKRTARKSRSIREEVEAIRDRLEAAAKRGDPTAMTLLKPNGDIPAVYFYKMESGGGIASRHPDLFLDTRFKPKRIKGVHRDSLKTKQREIRELAKRGIYSAKVMLRFIQGRSVSQIARDLNTSEKEVQSQLNFGTHIVFGIPLRRQNRVHLWEKLRKQHADVLNGGSK
ncbi:hypothetical protein HY571_01855 [Candidatus Micrarchaeota archaeon]|nr:hypothetical protein [Candidatus Micrarchaeota archaeon]